ncbi:hypothetical protein RvY_03636-3 [Ramazzottius varieornatus]|uniref:Uncharacterized protein n=1 Tax=Ramazzottius varieornatus TaxID=947166 RepID=A0A1D1UY67_RAMVA|nr:hypothetical protein RvY_03636-3 [Ramazzottius varieornatus]
MFMVLQENLSAVDQKHNHFLPGLINLANLFFFLIGLGKLYYRYCSAVLRRGFRGDFRSSGSRFPSRIFCPISSAHYETSCGSVVSVSAVRICGNGTIQKHSQRVTDMGSPHYLHRDL